MKTEIQPPRAQPLRVVGWLSLPWRYWVYLIGSLVFGLFFLTVAPVSLTIRALVLIVPFVISLGLAVPYGGLHADEWLRLALTYRFRPTATMTGPNQLKEEESDNEFDKLKAALEAGMNDPDDRQAAKQPDASPAPAAGMNGGVLRRDMSGGATLSEQPIAPPQAQPPASTGGIFRRRLPPVNTTVPAEEQGPVSSNPTNAPGFGPPPEGPDPQATPGRLSALRQYRNAKASAKDGMFLRDRPYQRPATMPIKRKR